MRTTHILKYMRSTIFNLVLIISLISCNTSIHGQDSGSNIGQYTVEFENVLDFHDMFEEINQRQLVLMGEASHGTSEFYFWRAELSKYLIEEKGFNFIAVEGDWPAFSRINEFVKHKPGAPSTIVEAMDEIDRWPLWMWRNYEVKELVQWLYDYNRDRNPENRVGIYGVDLYAKQDAMRDVVHWLTEKDPDLGGRAERLYACLSRFSEVRDYLMRVNRTGDDCSEDVQRVLEKVQQFQPGTAGERDWGFFNAEQNAKLVINAERHYRANLQQGPASWNYRAGHFELTSSRLLEFYGADSSGIVWAHNTHIGDARATDMGRHNMVNIGHLSRENLGRDNVYAIGFGTYTGEVFAARQWEGQRESMQVPEAVSGSWEYLLNGIGPDQFYLLFSEQELIDSLQDNIPHRAIGVTYQPEQEQGNYVPSLLPERYDAFIFIRETTTLQALD
jgi:erythromycin esterase